MQGTHLELRQLQKMVMTTELKQALDLLAMPLLELQQYVREQLETNPVLDDDVAGGNEEELFAAMTKDRAAERQSFTVNRDEPYVFEARTETYNNLYEYLLFQLNILPLSAKQREIGKYILACIDDNGYLLTLPEDIALEMGLPITEVAEVMAMIRRFDPAGVCCVNLEDCLLLQLDKDSPDLDALQKIIGNHLELVAANRVPQIAKMTKLPVATVNRLVEKIRSLDPRPGRFWDNAHHVEYVTPDITVRKIDDRWHVILNEWGVPKIAVSDYYQNLLKTGAALDAEAEEYLKEKFHAALWLMKAIEQRRKTINDAVMAIVKAQKGFFEDGEEFPAPLKLKDIADAIGVHESTVSRALNNKYLQTPRGLFSFKYFFPKAVAGVDKNALDVKKVLKDLIDTEDPRHPLRDGELTEGLKERGLAISRRTVAKYREQLGYPMAGKRKKF